jgi:chromosome segregation ATPase
MRRFVTLISAMALMVGMLALPAAADHNDEHTALQEAVEAAQAEVDRLEQEIADLEGELDDAEQFLEDAVIARDAAHAEVARIEGEIADAAAELEEAEAALLIIQQQLDAYRTSQTLTDDGCNNRNQDRLACVEALADEAAKLAEIDGLATEIEGLETDLATARDDLADREQDVTDAAAEVGRLEAELAEAERLKALADAELARAQAELDAYVDPVVEDEHPGCKGVKNAQEQVGKNGKGNGKAAQTLAEVAAKFECAA